MANTYTLINSNVLVSSATSITFSSIPATYTDLVLRYSARSDYIYDYSINLEFLLNGDTATNYSLVFMSGNGATKSSVLLAGMPNGRQYYGINNAATTSNTFASGEIYIPNYATSQNKQISLVSAVENNATTALLTASANLWRNSAAVSSITIYPQADNLLSGSSFYLYGISNS